MIALSPAYYFGDSWCKKCPSTKIFSINFLIIWIVCSIACAYLPLIYKDDYC